MGENAQGFLLRCTWGLCSMGSPLASCLPYQTIHSRLLCYTIPYHALPYTGMHMETVTYMGRFLALRQQHPPEDVLCPRLHPLWCSTSVSNQTLPYSLPYNVQWPYQTASSRNQPIPYRITQAKPCYAISDDNNDDNDGDDDDVDDDDDDGRARLNWLPPQRECRCWMVIGYRSRSPSITLIIITLQSTVCLLLNNCIKLIISLLRCICITITGDHNDCYYTNSTKLRLGTTSIITILFSSATQQMYQCNWARASHCSSSQLIISIVLTGIKQIIVTLPFFVFF